MGRWPLTGCPAEQSGASSGIGCASASAMSAAACAEAFASISPFTSRLCAVCLRRRRRRYPSSSRSTATTLARMRANATLKPSVPCESAEADLGAGGCDG